MRHVMVDLETLGRRPGSAILSIGAVEFDVEAGELGKEFYAVVEVPEGLQDAETLEWWAGQPKGTKPNPLRDERWAMTHGEAIASFHSFFFHTRARYLWCHASFDVPMLRWAHGWEGRTEEPWHWGDVRDLRTLVTLAGIVRFEARRGKHHALDDAKHQAELACRAWRSLRGRKKSK